MFFTIPALPWRWLAAGALIVAVGGYGYFKGAQSVRRDFDAYKAEIALKNAQLKAAQAEVTVKVVTKYVDRVRIVKEKSDAIVEQAKSNVAGSCPGSVRVYHDAAALQVPPAPRGADEGTTDAKDLAVTITENYGSCHQVRAQLLSLQEWVRENVKLDSK